MSNLVRFEADGVKVKARLYERSTRRLNCTICGDLTYGLLVRHQSPVKIPDTMICGQCIVLMSLSKDINLDDKTKFGPYSEINIIHNAARRKKRKPGVTKGTKRVKKASKPDGETSDVTTGD